MREEWYECTIQDFIDSGEAELKTGPFGTQLKAEEYVSEGIPVINVRNIGLGSIREAKLEHISEETSQRLSAHVLDASDIVFGRKGAVERHAFITNAESGWMQGSDCLRLRMSSPDVENRYLSYLFMTERHKQWMKNQCSHGSTMASLNQEIISRIPLHLPPLPIQRRIAEVLSAYDDLIENNKRRIELLEEMAQAVYREWFVEMRFPGHEDTAMRETDALGPVPEGWEIGEMSELLNRHMDTVKPYEEKEETFGYFSFNAHDEGRLPLLEQGGEIKSNKHEVKSNSVLLSKLNPRIPRTWMTFPKGEHRPITSTEFMVLVPNPPVTQTYLYSFLASTQFQRRFKSLASGTSTSHQRVSPRDFLSMPVALPSEDVLECFTEMVAPMLHQVHTLRLKNKTLRRTRDFLLPRLVSGEVEVRAKAEIEHANI